ncbi:MAG: hypothetical protein QOG68_1471, partial [Solirubrobacteraceae bacterium]|nr:hypothetical protein [Solirubrobacteraceae bacterium]
MSRLREFTLPDLGEGLTEGEILQWLVSVGDEVTLNQPIVEVETAKAAVEVPSPYAGVVTQLHHEAGEVVDVGSVIITFDTDPGAGPLDLIPEPPKAEGALIGEVGANGRTATLVGYGPKSGPAKRRARTDNPAPVVAEQTPPPPATAARVSAAAVGQAAAQTMGAVTVLAKPPVRKLAKELGVDLGALTGTGTGGVITRADVEAAGSLAPQAIWEPGTRERRIPVKGVRKLTAQAMVS